MSLQPDLDALTRKQTERLLENLCLYLEVDQLERALRRGLSELERRQLAYQLSIEFDLEESGFRSPQQSSH